MPQKGIPPFENEGVGSWLPLLKIYLLVQKWVWREGRGG